MNCSACGHYAAQTPKFCPECGLSQYASRQSENLTPNNDNSSQQKSFAAGQIVFSIINIVFLGFGVSTILGIIALILSVNASRDLDQLSAERKLSVAKVLNIIGIVFVAILMAIILAIFILAFVKMEIDKFSN